MSLNLSRFSIRQQILIGYIPVLLVLGFLILSSYQNFQKFNRSFDSLREITKEKQVFIEIEKDITELQRNVLVYSYVGYTGVLKKIAFLQTQLEKKFSLIEPAVTQDNDIKDRYERMLAHYHDYKEKFNDTVKQSGLLRNTNTESMLPLITQSQNQIDKLQMIFIARADFKTAYQMSEIKQDLLHASLNIEIFKQSLDSKEIRETRELIRNIKDKTSKIKSNLNESNLLTQVEDFLKTLKKFESTSNKIIRLNRNYLYLINVVLAGKAAEIDNLSGELDELIEKRAQNLSSQIYSNIKNSQNQFIILSVLAGLIGILSSIYIATDIANPVAHMAETLSKLSKGKANIEIPGQRRNDEVGQMAKAANEFKVMAKELENHTKELEEFAYRTSHDLRSPLVSSLGILNLAQENIDNKNYENAKKSINLASESLKKLEILVRDILELTKTKNLVEGASEIDFENIIEDALKKFSHMDNYNRLDIQTNVTTKELFKSQKNRIVLILENLISNAIKYQDTKKEHSFIKVSSYYDDRNIVLEVEDNGLGIPKKQQSQMFSMFKRFHPRVSFGSGLGLYMMKKSADVINGNIAFEDTGNGSKFRLIIPK